MADCYASLSGKPGIAEVPNGAGAMYGLPGIADANMSSMALILLVNDIPEPGVGRGTLTELPIGDLFRPIAKREETLGNVAKLPELLRGAFRDAKGGRPGAVVLALPEDILSQHLPESGISLHVQQHCIRAPSSRTRPGDEHIRAALDAIAGASRPLIVAGGGANRSGSAKVLTAFAELLGIPVASIITGQGIIRDDHRLGIGIMGTMASIRMPSVRSGGPTW